MDAVVSCRQVGKAFGTTQALDGLDLEVRPGEVHGFLGPNGSGKSVTLRIVLGLLRADRGSVALFGAILPRLGLLISLPLLVLISSWASDEFSWKATVINAVVLTAMSWVIFVKGLSLTIPVLPTIAGFGG